MGPEATADRGYTGWMATLFVLIVGLAAGSSWLGAQAVQIEGATALACDARGQVLVALDRKVYLLDPRGEIVLVLDRATDGEPFETLSTVAIDAEGRLLVGDAERHRIDFFDPTGKPLRAITSQARTGVLTLEVLPLRKGGLVVADSIGKRILWYGETLEAPRILKGTPTPAGLIELTSGNVLYSERGARHIHIVTPEMEKSWPEDPELPPWGKPYPKGGTIRHMRLEGKDALVMVQCRSQGANCRLQRLKRSGEPIELASLANLSSTIEAGPDTPEMGMVCALPSGELLFNSESHLGLWAIRGLEGGPPGPVGGERESTEERGVVAGRWLTQGPDNRLYRYGGTGFIEASLEVSQRRAQAQELSAFMLGCLYFLLIALLAAYAFFRTTGATGSDAQAAALQRIPLVWKRLVISDPRPLVVYFGLVGASVGLVFAAVYTVGTTVSATTLAIATGLFVSRRIGTPLVTGLRSRDHARTAFVSFFGREGWIAELTRADETVEFAVYAAPSGRTMLDRALRDILDILVPRLHLIVVTSRAVYSYPCTLFGTPAGRILQVDREDGGGSLEWGTEEISLRPRGWAEGLVFSSVNEGVSLASAVSLGDASIHCDYCAAPIVPSRTACCAHQRQRPTLARVLSVLPGLGHLYLRDFRRGRTLVFLTLAQSLDAYHWLAPKLMGTAYVTPGKFLVPILSLIGLWCFSLFDIHRRLLRDQIERSVCVPGALPAAGPAPPPAPTAPGRATFSAFLDAILRQGWDPDRAVAARRHLEEAFARHGDTEPATWSTDLLKVHLQTLQREGMSTVELKHRLETFRAYLAWARADTATP